MKRQLTQFRRLHVVALLAHRSAVASTIFGVGIGVAMVVGTQLLSASLTAPFAPLPTQLHLDGVTEIRPTIDQGISGELLASIRSVSGAGGAAAVWYQPVVVSTANGERPAIAVALDDPEHLFGSSASVESSATPASPTGSLALAGRASDLALGDQVRLAGAELQVGARVTHPTLDQFEGTLLLAPRPMNDAGTWSAVYLRSSDVSSGTMADLVSAVDKRATVGDPTIALPPAIVTTRDALQSLGAVGMFIGVLIAFNTLVLMVNTRLGSLATASAIGATRRSLLLGAAGEGAILVLFGGIIAMPLGIGLGALLVKVMGSAILDGAGLRMPLVVDPAVVLSAPTIGAIIGAITLWVMVRSPLKRPLDIMGGSIDRTSVGRVPRWLIPVGLAVFVLTGFTMAGVGTGALPVKASQSGLVFGGVSIACLAVGLIPSVVTWILRMIEHRNPVGSRLVRAEVNRVPVRLGLIVATVGLSAGMAGAFGSLKASTPEELSQRFDAAVPADSVLVSAQRPWDPRSSWIDPAALSAHGDMVPVRSTALIPSASAPRLIVGVYPQAELLRPFVTVDDPDALADALRRGDIALSQIAANRLKAEVGDEIELPTLQGTTTARVAAIISPGIPDDSTVGDWVVASVGQAKQHWGAQVRQAIASKDQPTSGLERFTSASWREATFAGTGRYFDPFALTGWIYLAAAVLGVSNFMLMSLVTRRRERAVLACVGADARHERSAIAVQATLQGLIAAVLTIVATSAFTYWLSTSSPAFYGFQLHYRFDWVHLALAVGASLVGVALATIRPWLVAGSVDTSEALRGE